MSWTYSGDPSASTIDAVRFLVGDTDTGDQLVQNEEVSFALANEGSTNMAAATICRAIAARFSRQADKTVGKLQISLSQKAKSYLEMANKLELKSSTLAMPYCGGLSIKEKENNIQDTSLPQPSFRRGLMDYGN